MNRKNLNEDSADVIRYNEAGRYIITRAAYSMNLSGNKGLAEKIRSYAMGGTVKITLREGEMGEISKHDAAILSKMIDEFKRLDINVDEIVKDSKDKEQLLKEIITPEVVERQRNAIVKIARELALGIIGGIEDKDKGFHELRGSARVNIEFVASKKPVGYQAAESENKSTSQYGEYSPPSVSSKNMFEGLTIKTHEKNAQKDKDENTSNVSPKKSNK